MNTPLTKDRIHRMLVSPLSEVYSEFAWKDDVFSAVQGLRATLIQRLCLEGMDRYMLEQEFNNWFPAFLDSRSQGLSDESPAPKTAEWVSEVSGSRGQTDAYICKRCKAPSRNFPYCSMRCRSLDSLSQPSVALSRDAEQASERDSVEGTGQCGDAGELSGKTMQVSKDILHGTNVKDAPERALLSPLVDTNLSRSDGVERHAPARACPHPADMRVGDGCADCWKFLKTDAGESPTWYEHRHWHGIGESCNASCQVIVPDWKQSNHEVNK